jgi:peptidoglycan/LPS O-acetylase OafA/YrhL
VAGAEQLREQTTAPTSAPHLAPVPAWDGLRGLAVLGVIVYHLQAPWLPGGFLGVSAFFTLSGFLITSLLLTEWDATGSIDLRRFWARRARRLFAALAVVLVGVLLAARRYATPGQLDHLRGDTLATLAYVANWRYLLTGVDYGGVSFNPSPLLHTWSLAIEEQFYLLFPLIVVAALRLRRREGLGVALVALLGGSLGLLLLVGHEPMRVYYGTDTRAAELVIGALGALAFHSATRAKLVAACRWLAPAALVGLIWSWHTAHETGPLLGQGGLALHALAVLVLVVAATAPGPVALVAGWWPLRQIGLLSYGIYLIHWPVFLWLTPLRTGWSTAATNGARLALTLGLAVLCAVLVEQPVRRGRWPGRRWSPFVLVGTGMAVVTAAVAFTGPKQLTPELVGAAGAPPSTVALTLPTPSSAPTTAAPAAPTPNAAPAATSAAPATPPPTTAPPTTKPKGPPDPATLITAGPQRLPDQPARILAPGSRPRISIVGDSLAMTLGYGLEDWGERTGLARVDNLGWIACGVVRGGEIRWVNGIVAPVRPDCDKWPTSRAADLQRYKPNLVVVLNGLWEMVDRRLAGSDQWQHIGEPTYDALVVKELSAFTELMSSRGATVLWLTYPQPATHVMAGLPGPFAEEDPARVARLNQLIGQVVASHPGTYELDLRTYMRDRPGGELDLAWRPDGFHWTKSTSELEAQWLGPLLASFARATSPA